MGSFRRKECPVLVARNQELALSSTIYILRNIGPLGFCLKEEGQSRDLKVFIGNRHSCTCSAFQKERDLCRHICWVILKRFKISKDDPISFQLGLIDRDIEGILAGGSKLVETVVEKQSEVSGDPETEVGSENKLRKPLLAGDVCPICQENFFEKHWPITYCRNGCGNNVHIRCMKIWSDHQIKDFGNAACETVKCPYCRGEFCTLSQLKKEYRTDPTRLIKFKREVVTTEEIDAEMGENKDDTGEIDEKMRQKKRQLALKVMESVPSHVVPLESRLLADGVQCCLCLKLFQAREFIGRLACRHRFHKNCLIDWFSENQPVCPIDQTPVEMKCSEAIKVVTKRYVEKSKDELNFLLCGRNVVTEAPLNGRRVNTKRNAQIRPRRNRNLNPIKTNSDLKSVINKNLSTDFALIGNKLQ